MTGERAPVALLSLGHRRARALASSGAPVFLGVNPVEYHGPHLSLHNDRLISEALSAHLHAAWAEARDWPLLVAPDLEIGVDPTPGPGTRATPYGVARRAVVRACEALADLGARRVVLGTFHGAPLHSAALQAGVDALARRGVAAYAPMHLGLARLAGLAADDFPDALAPVADAADRERLARAFPWDFHAGFLETSLTLALAPDSVADHRAVPPCPDVTPAGGLEALSRAAARLGRDALARELHMAALAAGWHALRPFPGYTSAPHLASDETGRRIMARLLPEIAETGARVLDGEAPHPALPMAWVARLTLGGRLGDVRAPASAVAETPP